MCLPAGGGSACHTPPVDRMTDTCNNTIKIDQFALSGKKGFKLKKQYLNFDPHVACGPKAEMYEIYKLTLLSIESDKKL